MLALSGAGSAAAFASSDVMTGLNHNTPATILFAIAGALLLTLAFRSTVNHLIRMITKKIGERRIRRILSQRSKDVLDDFLLPGAYGGLTRIDHAILTSGGIICIQTKHYNGIVFGDADEPQWTNVDGVHRRKFLNPLIQNEGLRSQAGNRYKGASGLSEILEFMTCEVKIRFSHKIGF